MGASLFPRKSVARFAYARETRWKFLPITTAKSCLRSIRPSAKSQTSPRIIPIPFYRTLGHITCICDRDAVVSATGAAKRELIEKPLSAEVENILQSRQISVLNLVSGAKMIPITSDDRAEAYTAQLVAPILADGEIIGGLILLSRDSGASMGEVDQKVAETTTSIIARQMEQ